MALDFETGEFACNTSTGDQVISGLGFTPKAVILMGTRSTVDGSNQTLAMSWGVFTSPTEEWVMACVDEDAADPMVTDKDMREDACILFMADGGGVDGKAIAKPFTTNAFTVEWTNAPVAAYKIHYVILGGSDVTNIKAGIETLTALSTADQSFTDTGFQPDLVLFACNGSSSFATSPNAKMGWGAGTSSTARHSIKGMSEDGEATSDTFRDVDFDTVIDVFDDDGGTDGDADLKTMDTNGWTLSIGDDFSAAFHYGYLAIKGGQFFVGNYTKSTGGAPVVQQRTGIGFQPVGLMLFSHGSTSITNPSGWETDIGFSDLINDGSVWISARDSRASSDVRTRTRADRVMTDGSQANGNESWAGIVTADDNDSYTITWDPNVASAYKLLDIVFGSEDVAGGDIRRHIIPAYMRLSA